MILGILLVCSVDMGCFPVPNTQTLFDTREECETAATEAITNIPDQYTVEIYCYEVNYSVST